MTVECTFTPIRDGYSVVPTYPIRETLLDGAATRKYTNALFAPHEVTVNWKLVNPSQYTAFMGFFRTTLFEATEYFLMDLVTDIGAVVPHRCRTKGGMPKLTQVSGNCFYVSAVLEVEVNPTYTGLILYEEPNIISFTHTTPRLVGPLQPGDIIRIFNSSGTHPGGSQWEFDGVDDRVTFGTLFQFQRTDPFSLSIWFSTTSSSPQRLLSNEQLGSTSRGYALSLRSGGQLNFQLANNQFTITNTLTIVSSSSGFNDGNLHHFLVTYDGSSSPAGVVFYLDGVTISMSTFANTLSATTIGTGQLAIGGQTDATQPFEGILQHAAIWDVELNSTMAAEVYAAGTPPDLENLTSSPDPIFWVKLNAGDATGSGGVIDHIGANNGTTQGGLAPTSSGGSTDLNLDGMYEIETVTPNNQISLVDPELVNIDWTTLAGLGSPGQYGTELLGNVISTLTRIPS